MSLPRLAWYYTYIYFKEKTEGKRIENWNNTHKVR